MAKNIHDRLKGCLILGAVGDALGSHHESDSKHRPINFDNISGITDDTQLTLATCESSCSGHVAESVPLAIFSAQKIRQTNPQNVMHELISCGGDTDTNASIAGHIMGSYLGYSDIPSEIRSLFDRIAEKDYILDLSEKLGGIAFAPGK